jgi:hypothetical protein
MTISFGSLANSATPAARTFFQRSVTWIPMCAGISERARKSKYALSVITISPVNPYAFKMAANGAACSGVKKCWAFEFIVMRTTRQCRIENAFNF